MTFAQLWKSADWYCALTLCERVPIRGNLSNQSLSDAAGTKQARERLLLWKQLHCFTSRASFNERLAMDGLTESDLLHLLRETPEDLRQRVGYRPEWLKLLESAFEQSSTSTANNAKPANKETPQDRKAFVALVKPLVTYGRKYLRKRLARIASQHDHHPLGPDHCDSLFAPMLLERLLVLVQRTAILDLNVRRLLGHLEGESPQQRFQSYAQLLDDPTYSLGLLAEYPLLAREAVVYVNQWISFVSCVFEHLHTDWPLISSTFCVDLSDRIQRIHRTSAETHFGGRVVLILDLQSGSKLVYKPRSVATEEHFQHLLEWLNSVKPPPYFRILRVLDRDDHGWCEYVPSKECHSREAVRRFYERLGGYLALLYTLSGTDFHHENIIASGEHPVIIDLETLFHPDTQQGRKHRGEAHIIEHAFWESVMATGLLPLHVWANSEYEGIDLSAVGADQDQLTPDEIPIIEADGSDAIRVVRARFRLHSGYHQPRLNGRLMEISQFAEYFVSGFELTYDTILTHRKDLTDTQGLLSRFRGSVLRVILRPTRTYSLLLQESLHPDLLKDGLDRERFFDQLWLKSAASHQSTLVLLAERESLYKGDVPVFATKAGDRDLWCNGQLLHTDFFRRSGMELAMDRIGDMCDADRDRQCWYIRASLATKAPRIHPLERRTQVTKIRGGTKLSRRLLIEAASKIGDRLVETAYVSNNDVAWIGLCPRRKGGLALTPIGLDLYSGLPGIGMFLSYLGYLSEDLRYTILANKIGDTVLFALSENIAPQYTIGAFSGWGGIIYSLCHMAVVLDRPELLSVAIDSVKIISDVLEADRQYDIIGGAAGAIGCLLVLHSLAASSNALRVAKDCGDHLVQAVQNTPSGAAWISNGVANVPLTGFSHGAAGISWALMHLGAIVPSRRYTATGLCGIQFERGKYCAEAKNWLDLRYAKSDTLKSPRLKRCSTFWCHGAPGIGLARLSILTSLNDSDSQHEIQTAIETTLREGFGHNHSLCHGDLGNLELIITAAEILHDQHLAIQTREIGSRIVDSFLPSGWKCGIPGGVETPGLMMGLAGIGYELLRLACPEQVPSVLTLEPPL